MHKACSGFALQNVNNNDLIVTSSPDVGLVINLSSDEVLTSKSEKR